MLIFQTLVCLSVLSDWLIVANRATRSLSFLRILNRLLHQIVYYSTLGSRVCFSNRETNKRMWTKTTYNKNKHLLPLSLLELLVSKRLSVLITKRFMLDEKLGT